MTSAGEAGAITYYSSHTDSTPLRCCLKDDEWHENVNACTGVDDDEKSWTWDDTTNTCTESTCTRYNLYLPTEGNLRDAILILRGDTCEPQGTATVDRDTCCYEIQEGCGDEEGRPPLYVGGSCTNDDCSTCSLEYYDATNYFG